MVQQGQVTGRGSAIICSNAEYNQRVRGGTSGKVWESVSFGVVYVWFGDEERSLPLFTVAVTSLDSLPTIISLSLQEVPGVRTL